MIAKRILKNSNLTVGFFVRTFFELHPCGSHSFKVLIERIGMQKKTNPSSGLIADCRDLLWSICFCKQQSRLCIFRRDQNPTLGVAEVCAFDQVKGKNAQVKLSATS